MSIETKIISKTEVEVTNIRKRERSTKEEVDDMLIELQDDKIAIEIRIAKWEKVKTDMDKLGE